MTRKTKVFKLCIPICFDLNTSAGVTLILATKKCNIIDLDQCCDVFRFSSHYWSIAGFISDVSCLYIWCFAFGQPVQTVNTTHYEINPDILQDIHNVGGNACKHTFLQPLGNCTWTTNVWKHQGHVDKQDKRGHCKQEEDRPARRQRGQTEQNEDICKTVLVCQLSVTANKNNGNFKDWEWPSSPVGAGPPRPLWLRNHNKEEPKTQRGPLQGQIKIKHHL